MAKCKYCKKDFKIDHNNDDEASEIKEGYYVKLNVQSEMILPKTRKRLEGVTGIVESMVHTKRGSYCTIKFGEERIYRIDIYDLLIDYEANKDNWESDEEYGKRVEFKTLE